MKREKGSMNARKANSMGSGEAFILRPPFLSSVVMALMLAISALPSMASTACTTVTSTADDGSSGTLRYAIAQVNARTCDTIAFNLNSYPATITLAQGQLEISNTTTAITISGPGAMNVAISGNNATRVFQIDSGVTVSISGITISSGNSNGSNAVLGGGILIITANVTITNSTFSGNFANYGGGIYNSGGTMTVTNSTFSGNTQTAVGAGFANDGGGTATVTNSTFSGNHGNGIYNGGTATVANSTFSGGPDGQGIFNGGTVTVKNTLLTTGSSGQPNCAGGGTFISDGHNLSDDGSCSFNGIGDLNNTPAGLDPGGLRNNGGPTQTIAILPSSAAFNVIPLSPTNYCTDVVGNPVTTDQRGFSRPQVSACDIGAFEYSSDNDSALAGLSGGNTFSGNQTINGNLTATSFNGNGSGLTGVNAATATTASGLSCAGCVGNPQLAVNYAASPSQGGAASNALLFGGLAPSAFPSLGSNTFTGQQFMPALSVSSHSGNAAVSVQNSFATGIQASGVDYGVYGSGAWGLYGSSTSAVGVGVQGVGSGAGVAGQSFDGAGLSGVTLHSGVAGVFNATNGGKILSGQNNGTEVLSIANNGNLATTGSITIGGGTAIVEYVSTTNTVTIPALTPGTCSTFTTAALTGFTPGSSDTIALGTPASLVSSLGSGIFLQYQAWETTATTSPTITIQVCNPTAVKYKGGATGTIRIDLFKH